MEEAAMRPRLQPLCLLISRNNSSNSLMRVATVEHQCLVSLRLMLLLLQPQLNLVQLRISSPS